MDYGRPHQFHWFSQIYAYSAFSEANAFFFKSCDRGNKNWENDVVLKNIPGWNIPPEKRLILSRWYLVRLWKAQLFTML